MTYKPWKGWALALSPAILAGMIVLFSACPQPPQPPTPPPAGPTMQVLRIEGARFIPAIWGAAAGSGRVDYGWPLASIAYLDALKSNGLNYSHVRGGGYVEDARELVIFAQAPDGRYDLNKFNPTYDATLRTFYQETLNRGIYVEKVPAGTDTWVWKVNKTPFNGAYNVNGINYYVGEGGDHYSILSGTTPPVEVERAIRHDVAIACEFPHVFFQVDNEARTGRTSAEWTRSVYRIVKEVCPNRLVGSDNTDAWDTVDYQVLHTSRVPAPSLKPVLVNETANNEISPEQYVLKVQRGQEVGGVWTQYWPGPSENKPAEVSRALELLGQYVRGQRWDYGCPNFRGIKVSLRFESGVYKTDASPIPFSEGADQQTSLGQGLCEDIWINSPTPQRYQDGYGPAWSITVGTIEPNWNNPYLAFVHDPVAGSSVVKACSRADSNCGVFAF